MANIIPSQQEIDGLPVPLTEGERELLGSLLNALDESWTIYVQPHLNGLRPDFVIFSRSSGIGVIEVKDWTLEHSKISVEDSSGEAIWHVRGSDGAWHKRPDDPLKQLDKYWKTLNEHQLAEIFVDCSKEREYSKMVCRFLYFSRYDTLSLNSKIPQAARGHVLLFGRDKIDAVSLRTVLHDGGLRKNSLFAKISTDAVVNRLENLLGYPSHGWLDARFTKLAALKLSQKQRDLLPNDERWRRVIGAAGSGKTVVAAHKAVDAASEGKHVFITCFNITMANYLRDAVTQLARQLGPHVIRNIEVQHFHSAFNHSTGEDRRNMTVPADVLLIDEGQDFKRDWIQTVQSCAAHAGHFMFFEDLRQNVYGIDSSERLILPGVQGRPNILNSSHRVPPTIANLANAVASLSKRDDDVVLESIIEEPTLFAETLPLWEDCETVWEAANRIVASIITLLDSKDGPHPADVAILVCNHEQGRVVLDCLEANNQPYSATFPNETEHERLRALTKERSGRETRPYKVAFWMQTGRVKVSTIHSFKGWELAHIYVLFSPTPKQRFAELELLYTAVTRAQTHLAIFTANLPNTSLGRTLTEMGVLDAPNIMF